MASQAPTDPNNPPTKQQTTGQKKAPDTTGMQGMHCWRYLPYALLSMLCQATNLSCAHDTKTNQYDYRQIHKTHKLVPRTQLLSLLLRTETVEYHRSFRSRALPKPTRNKTKQRSKEISTTILTAIKKLARLRGFL